jgi:hypothetical protein
MAAMNPPMTWSWWPTAWEALKDLILPAVVAFAAAYFAAKRAFQLEQQRRKQEAWDTYRATLEAAWFQFTTDRALVWRMASLPLEEVRLQPGFRLASHLEFSAIAAALASPVAVPFLRGLLRAMLESVLRELREFQTVALGYRRPPAMREAVERADRERIELIQQTGRNVCREIDEVLNRALTPILDSPRPTKVNASTLEALQTQLLAILEMNHPLTQGMH